MQIAGSYDIIKTLFDVGTQPYSAQTDITDTLFSNALAARYTNTVNDLLTNEVSSFMDSLNTEVDNINNTMDTLFNTNAEDFEITPLGDTENEAAVLENPTIEGFDLNVEQVAEAQENTGDNVEAEATNTLDNGTQTLTLNQGDNTFDINVTVQSYDTNRTVFNRIADEVNNGTTDINATVVENDEGQIALQFTANETGETNGFNLEGNLADALNLNQVTQEAQNAQYDINGVAFETETNTVTADNGNIELQLNEPTDGPIAFEVTENETAITDEVNRFTDQFNDFKTFLNEASNNRQVDLINRQVDNLTQRFEEDLNTIGIVVNTNGTLEVNEGRLQEAVAEDVNAVRETFTGTASFGDRLQGRIETIEELPASTFVENQITASTSTAFSNNPLGYLSNAQSVNLAAIQSQGNLIDIMF